MKFDVSEYQRQRPIVQLAPLVDIAFWALMFFMVIAVYNQMEAQVNMTLPKSKTAVQSAQSAGKIVINITRDGRFIVNQKQYTPDGLTVMLAHVSKLFPNQQVIIRADALTYHKYVIQALDACGYSHLTDISFSAIKDENP
ncbi:MAG: biopolymer transporter ExbD [Candidatus Omnitrophica bacterium]|nr:biopolymer transporter ExbD [Candidatus Omnitrophota bacterium]MDE2008928.1 biopolymer transporter ExbD [Candidatus Omnitrophota bacterium]MDE2213509.1 biopolymer transporter ExbD [Candidatus Omnitrophota bacterium]MDE2230590.1 biopolymer transporter ExbD [Candidatus Omnitrophota bacterium]